MERATHNSNKVYKLDGKIAVVTSSTCGIGFATARRLAQEGAKVIICSGQAQNVSSAVMMLKLIGLDAIGVVCDVSKCEDREKLFHQAKKLGGVDILVAFSGANTTPEPLVNCTEDHWDNIFELNTKVPFLLAKECLPLLRTRGGGSIVFIGSLGTHKVNLGAYSASKSAVVHLTQSFAQEYSKHNITVNCIVPGFIDTRFAQVVMDDREAIISRIPMNRIGSPSDCAGVVAFLVSEDASYITGESVTIAGGLCSNL